MRLLDLFSGIGGFALAAQKTFKEDLEIVGFCEIEDYARRVLSKNFPGVPIHEDICKMDGNNFKDIDLITGGFPCQDISISGEGKGIKNGTRSGLWFELHRIISEVRPKFALIENVPMLTRRGGTRVISDLTSIGYDCEWQVISAAEIGARHLRKRIWIVAYPKNHIRRGVQYGTAELCGREQHDKTFGNTTSTRFKRSGETSQTVSNTQSERLSRCRRKESGGNKKRMEQNSQEKQSEVRSKSKRCSGVYGDVSNTDSEYEQRVRSNHTKKRRNGQKKRSIRLCDRTRKRGSIKKQIEIIRRLGRGFNGISSWMDGSWEEGIPKVTKKQENRTKRLTGLGNAIVPQNAQIIMEFIKPHITQQEK